MASVRLFLDKAVATAYLGYDSNKKQVKKKKTFHRPEGMTPAKWRKEAQHLAEAFEKSLCVSGTIDVNIRLKDFIPIWFEQHCIPNCSERTREGYSYDLERFVTPELLNKRLNSITTFVMTAFINDLAEKKRADGSQYSDRTVRYVFKLLSSILNKAVKWGVIETNPCKNVILPKARSIEEQRIKHMDLDQAQAFIRWTKDLQLKYQVGILCAMLCGMRQEEILGLQAIDIDRDIIHIRRARSLSKESGMHTISPKADGYRSISMPTMLQKAINALLKEQEAFRALDSSWNPEGWLLAQDSGEGMYYGTLSKKVADEIRRHNANNELQIPIMHLHALRHTSATLMIANNVDIKTVSTRLGHKEISTTLNIYTHALKEADRAASDALEILFQNKPIISPQKRKMEVITKMPTAESLAK